jgi:hypothetical protein
MVKNLKKMLENNAPRRETKNLFFARSPRGGKNVVGNAKSATPAMFRKP